MTPPAPNPRRSGRAPTLKQAPNRVTIDRRCSPLKPIKRREPIVVPGGRIGAVIEKNLDGLHEARPGGVVDGGRPPTVASLPGKTLVLDTRAVAQKSRNKLGVVLSSLVPGTAKPDPRPRSIDASSRGHEHRRKLRTEDPATCPDRYCVRSMFEKHCDHRHILARHRFADGARSTEQGLIGLLDG